MIALPPPIIIDELRNENVTSLNSYSTAFAIESTTFVFENFRDIKTRVSNNSLKSEFYIYQIYWYGIREEDIKLPAPYNRSKELDNLKHFNNKQIQKFNNCNSFKPKRENTRKMRCKNWNKLNNK